MNRLTSSATFLGVVLLAGAADARDLHKVAPAGGGLDSVDVVVDSQNRVVKTRRCKTADCTDGGAYQSIPVPIDVANATIDVIAVGDGRHVVHVKIPDSKR